ncbi:MAG: hypothetical protein P4M11_15325 [Candidatus Pacebacteria bacterium]|nr:hypothetical protein [Candidatus Paceibacterota bacterium]
MEEVSQPAVPSPQPAGTKDDVEINVRPSTSIIAFPDGSVNIAVESTPVKFVLPVYAIAV